MARLAKDFERLAKAKGNTATSAYRQLMGGALPRSESSKAPAIVSTESRNVGQLINSLDKKTRKAVMKEFLKKGADYQLGIMVGRSGGSW
ncbi:MAG: hypothetical protein ABR985_03800 [Methanotrichaceae archaeon]|jgi:hypothetical protein